MRLRRIAEAEAAVLVASGEVSAVGLTGSLSTGRLWPSSDLDMLITTEKPVENRFRWTVREGVVNHGCLVNWASVEAFRDRYPESFVDLTADEYAMDSVWALDGMVAMEVMHDPTGRLGAVKDFVAQRRFDPEVVRMRRPLLLARARKELTALGTALAGNPADEARWHYRKPVDLLAVVWLEKAGLVVSHKEIDPNLGDIGAATGNQGFRDLFRRAEGVAHLAVKREETAGVFDAYLRLYSPALAAVLESPGGGRFADDPYAAANCVYLRHTIWSVRYALERDCLLHLGCVRDVLAEDDPSLLPRLLARCGRPMDDAAASALSSAHRRALETLAPGPWEPRAAAFEELLELGAGLAG